MGFGSFFHHIFDFFRGADHAQPWAKSAVTTLRVLAPMTAELIASAAGEPAADEFTKGVNEVQNDLALASGVFGQAVDSGDKSKIGEAITALNAVKQNLPALLAAGHVKDPAKVDRINGIAGRIVAEIDAVLSLMPAQEGSAAPASS